MIDSTDLASQPTFAPEVAALFPKGVVAAVLTGPSDPAQLHPREREAVQRVAPKRLHDYAAGRQCARFALRALGVEEFPLLPGPGRQPLWPPGIVGSLTHTRGYCTAVVAPRTALQSLGIDTEVIADVHEELWSRICTQEELQWLHQQTQQLRTALAALLFAAKESFYKCQYPLTQEWLGFEDVRIALPEEGRLQVIPQRPIRLASRITGTIEGRYRFHQRWVSAGIALN